VRFAGARPVSDRLNSRKRVAPRLARADAGRAAAVDQLGEAAQDAAGGEAGGGTAERAEEAESADGAARRDAPGHHAMKPIGCGAVGRRARSLHFLALATGGISQPRAHPARIADGGLRWWNPDVGPAVAGKGEGLLGILKRRK
jgi:hypothetical protein